MPSEGDNLTLGKLRPDEQRSCTLIFNAPSTPTECTLNLVMNYTLESDGVTEIQKTLALDIPIIQPFHTTFNILPRVVEDGGMPDPFMEGELRLHVAQSWLLMSSVNRLGSEDLELQRVDVSGSFGEQLIGLEVHGLEGSYPSEDQTIGAISQFKFLIEVLDSSPYTAKSLLTLSRVEDAELSTVQLELRVEWRRRSQSQTFEWNSTSIPIPELTFFPFMPRVLAGKKKSIQILTGLIQDVGPLNQDSAYPQFVMTYIIENPTPQMVQLDIRFESTDECGFSGLKSCGMSLLAFSSHEVKAIIIPLRTEWAKLPRLVVTDSERKRVLEILRVTDDLKIEGSDLFLRISSKK